MGKNNHEHHMNSNKFKSFLNEIKWFIIWVLIYAIFYIVFEFLLDAMIGTAPFYKIEFIHALIFGLCFSVATRVVWAVIHGKTIYLGTDVFTFWILAYGLSIWFFEFLKGIFIQRFNLVILNNMYITSLFIAVGVDIVIRLLKRTEFGFQTRFPRILRAPSQIFTGILLTAIGVLTFRFSTIIFIDWLRWTEGLAWSWLIGLVFIIAGFLTLVAWWRNNVLQHRIGIKIGHWG